MAADLHTIRGRSPERIQATGGAALARQLVREGVTQVFGVPGVQLDWALDGLAQAGDAIAYRTTRHEQAAAYMADGYARTTGTVGVCMVVPGPGLLNAMAGLATAYACSSPVLCIAGQIPSAAIGRGLGLLHEIRDQSSVMGTVTKWHAMARKPEEIPGLVREAFRQMRSGRPRPAGIEIPPDVLQAAGEVAVLDPDTEDGRVPPDPAALARAAELLRGAAFPVIYAGWGVQAADATEELERLAEALQAPVVMSHHGRGSLSDRHPLALTTLGGRAVLPRADVILVAGSRFVTGRGEPVLSAPGTRFVVLNADAADLGEPRKADVVLHGDAKLGLAGLLERLDGGGAGPSRGQAVARVRAWCDAQMAEIEPQWSWVKALRTAIPEDGILITELTQVSYLAQVAYPVYAPRTFITPGYQGTLGYGFATALGAAAGNQGRAVVSITGDGGFGWTLQELATARQYSLGLATVVFVDNAFGNVKRTQRLRFGGRVLGVDLVNPDFMRLAEAFGIASTRVETPSALAGALREAVTADGPVLIEVPVGEMPSPWHLIHDFVPPPRPAPAHPFAEGDPSS